MNCRLLSAAAVALMLSGVSASAAVTIACERGPFPKLSIINGASEQFITSIQASYEVSRSDAEKAAEYVCADMSAVGEPDKLRALTRAAVADFRPRR